MEPVDDLASRVVRIGGRDVENGWDRVARYCGLPWSGGDNETWAFRYYDAVPSRNPDDVLAVDVLAAAALHPGLRRTDLTWFYEERRSLSRWLEELPEDRALGGCSGEVAATIAGMATWATPVGLPLLSKVLHRKRPKLIPLLDRHVVDWYRPITGERSAARAWPGILLAMRDDLDIANAVLLSSMASAVAQRTFDTISVLRVMDIIIWMGAHRDYAN